MISDMNATHIKIISSIFAIALVVLSITGWVDEIGESYTEQGLKRALITYGIARGLNGVISVAQGTEVAVEPMGVGLTLTPGQILDPINDLVERFSWVVLASGASLGAQRILIQVTSWYWFTALVALMVACALFVLWKEQGVKESVKQFIYRLTLVLIIVRFVIPVIAIVNEGIYVVFLQPQYEEAKQNLERTADEIETINKENLPVYQKDQSFVEKIKQQYQSVVDAMDIDRQLDAMKKTVSEISESTLNMIVVFMLQTIIFPLLFLWLAVKLMKSVFTWKMLLS